MRNVFLPLIAGVAIAVPLSAQSATYDLFGTGCNGGTRGTCATQNATNPTFTSRTLANEYAYAVVNSSTSAVTVVGFSIYTESTSLQPANVRTGVYYDVSGAGAQVHTNPNLNADANGTIDVAGPLGWYRTNVYPPLVMQPGEAFWISADTNAIRPPDAGATGSPGVVPSKWRRPPFGGGSWSTTGIIQAPIFEIHCHGSTSIPTLMVSAPPRLGTTMNLDLSTTDPNANVAFLLWGLNNASWNGLPLPLDMGIFGAPQCEVLQSSDVTQLVLVAGGASSFPFAIPNSMSLSGTTFFNQYAEVRPGANSINLVMSNGGAGVLGN